MKTTWLTPTRVPILRVATVMALTTALLLQLATAAENSELVTIADFEKDTDGFSRPLLRDAAVAQQGQGSGKIEVTFCANKRWVTANRVLDLPHELKEVRFWARSTDARGLTFRLIDETGQTHQQRPKFAADGKWHQITINTFTSGEGYERFGGAADGRFHWPAQSIAFIFENDLPEQTVRRGPHSLHARRLPSLRSLWASHPRTVWTTSSVPGNLERVQRDVV